jgi:hypothetical protein
MNSTIIYPKGTKLMFKPQLVGNGFASKTAARFGWDDGGMDEISAQEITLMSDVTYTSFSYARYTWDVSDWIHADPVKMKKYRAHIARFQPPLWVQNFNPKKYGAGNYTSKCVFFRFSGNLKNKPYPTYEDVNRSDRKWGAYSLMNGSSCFDGINTGIRSFRRGQDRPATHMVYQRASVPGNATRNKQLALRYFTALRDVGIMPDYIKPRRIAYDRNICFAMHNWHINEVYGTLSAVRMASEYPKYIGAFCECLDHGCHPLIAAAMTQGHSFVKYSSLFGKHPQEERPKWILAVAKALGIFFNRIPQFPDDFAKWAAYTSSSGNSYTTQIRNIAKAQLDDKLITYKQLLRRNPTKGLK